MPVQMFDDRAGSAPRLSHQATRRLPYLSVYCQLTARTKHTIRKEKWGSMRFALVRRARELMERSAEVSTDCDECRGQTRITDPTSRWEPPRAGRRRTSP